MLQYTHTYLINRLFQIKYGHNIPSNYAELLLGNVVPDLIPFIGTNDYQPLAHDFVRYENQKNWRLLTLGGYFHILCDNISTLGIPRFDGSYYDYDRLGFLEIRAGLVHLLDGLRTPLRRVLQCGLDFLVLRQMKSEMMQLIRLAVQFLNENKNDVTEYFASLYGVETSLLWPALSRLAMVYGDDFIETSSTVEHRAFPLARDHGNLPLDTPPEIVGKYIEDHLMLVDVIKQNLHLIKNDWQAQLDYVVQVALKNPTLEKQLDLLVTSRS
ncbi:hypothetical protein JW960_08525 [candidate division KSB1 bacterium]|nr:hypothetical protein [candidate division KSB1 bacterium]